MVGHKLGEFAPTRQFAGHTPAEKKAATTSATPSPAQPSASSGVKDGKK